MLLKQHMLHSLLLKHIFKDYLSCNMLQTTWRPRASNL